MGVKSNPLLAQFEAKIRMEERVARDVVEEIDMMSLMILLNDNFKVGATRAPVMLTKYLAIKKAIATSVVQDGKDDDTFIYTKHTLASRLKQIFGANWAKVQKNFPMVQEFWEDDK